jgi:hypothetical protein
MRARTNPHATLAVINNLFTPLQTPAALGEFYGRLTFDSAFNGPNGLASTVATIA